MIIIWLYVCLLFCGGQNYLIQLHIFRASWSGLTMMAQLATDEHDVNDEGVV